MLKVVFWTIVFVLAGVLGLAITSDGITAIAQNDTNTPQNPSEIVAEPSSSPSSSAPGYSFEETPNTIEDLDDGATVLSKNSQKNKPKKVREQEANVPKPDIIVIMTDDQRAGTEQAMPNTWKFFQQTSTQGKWYPNTQVPTNLCCPARAAFLTGKYATTTGVWDNKGKYGGYERYAKFENETLPVWLKQVGYQTGLFGKLLNGFPGKNSPDYTPPGWDAFNVFNTKQGAGYYAPVRGLPEGEYTTDSLGKATSDFIAQAPKDTPLFAYYAPFAPHAPYDAGPYKDTSTSFVLDQAKEWGFYKNPSYNVLDYSKPSWFWSLPRVKGRQMGKVVRGQVDTLQGVDANVQKIIDAVAEHRNIDNTLFIYMGDNGYAWGDFRLYGKRNPHILTNEVPLLVRYPTNVNVGTQPVDARLANNIDVSATILSLAGVENKTAGQSLLSENPRDIIPLEAAATMRDKKTTVRRPAYCGVRTRENVFMEYSTGEKELYDLVKDPYQLNNLAGNPKYSSLEQNMLEKTVATGCNLQYLTTTVEPHLKGANGGFGDD